MNIKFDLNRFENREDIVKRIVAKTGCKNNVSNKKETHLFYYADRSKITGCLKPDYFKEHENTEVDPIEWLNEGFFNHPCVAQFNWGKYPNVMAIAMDKDGSFFKYRNIPEPKEVANHWYERIDRSQGFIGKIILPNLVWEECIIKRPDVTCSCVAIECSPEAASSLDAILADTTEIPNSTRVAIKELGNNLQPYPAITHELDCIWEAFTHTPFNLKKTRRPGSYILDRIITKSQEDQCSDHPHSIYLEAFNKEYSIIIKDDNQEDIKVKRNGIWTSANGVVWKLKGER